MYFQIDKVSYLLCWLLDWIYLYDKGIFLFRVYHGLRDRRIFKLLVQHLVSFGDTNVLPHVNICPMFVKCLTLPSQLRDCWEWVPRWDPCFIKSSP